MSNKGCELDYDPVHNCWNFTYGGELVICIGDEYVGKLAGVVVTRDENDVDTFISSMQAFRMLVGEWLLSCVERQGYDFATGAWLTKMQKCAIQNVAIEEGE